MPGRLSHVAILANRNGALQTNQCPDAMTGIGVDRPSPARLGSRTAADETSWIRWSGAGHHVHIGIEGLGDSLKRACRWVGRPSLDAADVALIDAAALGEFGLSETMALAQFDDLQRDVACPPNRSR